MRGLAALEEAKLDSWVFLLLPWMSDWIQISAALLECISPQDPRHALLIKSLAQQVQHALQGEADRAILSMRTLDGALLKAAPGPEEVPALVALEVQLDSWLETYIRSTAYEEDTHSRSNSRSHSRSQSRSHSAHGSRLSSPTRASNHGEAFQAACQLRARLAISLAGMTPPPPPSLDLHGEAAPPHGKGRKSDDDGTAGVDFSTCRTILRNALGLENKNITGEMNSGFNFGSKGTTAFPPIMPSRSSYSSAATLDLSARPSSASAAVETNPRKAVIALAASAAIGALFGDGLSTSDRNNNSTSSFASHTPEGASFSINEAAQRIDIQHSKDLSLIASDPNPVSPARVVVSLLCMLRRTRGPEPGFIIPEGLLSVTSQRMQTSQIAKEVLPLLLWAAAELVDNREEQQVLLNAFLLGEKYFSTRKGLANSRHFSAWSQKEVIGLGNRLRTDPSLEISFVGEEGPGIGAAMHAVFPAALLSPAALLQALVAGAVGESGRAELVGGVIRELPALKVARSALEGDGVMLNQAPIRKTIDEASMASAPATTSLLTSHSILMEVLKEHLDVASIKALDEGATLALEKGVLTLCSTSMSNSARREGVQEARFGPMQPPAVAPEELLEYAVLPLLHQAGTDVVANANEMALALRLSRRLLEIVQISQRNIADTAPLEAILFPNDVESVLERSEESPENGANPSGSSFEETTRSSKREVLLGQELLACSLPLLSFSTRRIDLNSRGLELSLAAIEEAHALAMLCSTAARQATEKQEHQQQGQQQQKHPYLLEQLRIFLDSPSSIGEIDPGTVDLYLRVPEQSSPSHNEKPLLPGYSASTVWASADALCKALALYAVGAAEAGKRKLLALCNDIGMRGLREALVLTCAVMLPCSSTQEATEIRKGITDAVRWALSMATSSASSNSSAEGSLRGLTSTAEVRGLVIEVLCRAVHAVALVPGLVPVAGENIAALATEGPSELRARAVARLTQHLSLACQEAVSIPASNFSDSSTSSAGAGRTRSALTARAFREVSRCAAAIQEYYDVSALRVCLLHLAQVLKHEGRDGELPPQVRNIVAAAAVEFGDPAVISTLMVAVGPE